MLATETSSSRLPRGTKPVSRAFFEALDAVPQASRAMVAKAALVIIRDGLKAEKTQMKADAANAMAPARRGRPPKA